MRKYKRRHLTKWKCQDCGLTFKTVIGYDPWKGIKCPCCGNRGVKEFVARHELVYAEDGKRIVERKLVEKG